VKFADPVLASRVFGVYLAANGAGFFLAPALILPRLGLPAPADEWIRIVGILSAILGMYFVYCAQPGQRRFFQATVIARLMFFSGVLSLVLLGLAPPLLVLFGLIDLAGAGWTQYALHKTS
jgi:uncharacterized membrane protein HdeD (DUF308 family)